MCKAASRVQLGTAIPIKGRSLRPKRTFCHEQPCCRISPSDTHVGLCISTSRHVGLPVGQAHVVRVSHYRRLVLVSVHLVVHGEAVPV